MEKSKIFDKFDSDAKKTIILFVTGIGFYLYRLALIPNCLFRVDSQNVKRFCFGAIHEGLIGPLRSIYLAMKYKGIGAASLVFKELFLSFDNPVIIFSSLATVNEFFL